MSFRVQTKSKYLHKPCIEREDNSSGISKVKAYLMMNKKKAVGIAANQLFLNNRVFGIWFQDHLLIFENPVVEKIKGVQESVEGCMSIKDGKMYYKKIRPTEVTISSKNHNTMTFKDYYATVILHEMDHLDGVLISDHNLNSPVSISVEKEDKDG